MIPVAIVSHSIRRIRLQRLSDAVKAEFVAIDDGRLGPGSNHDVAWNWLSDSPNRWSVVLEDDALPVKGFRSQLDMVLKVAPSPIVSLYLGRGRPPQWQTPIQSVIARPEHFRQASELLHHVGVAMQTHLIPRMLEERDHTLPIDESIGKWARDNAIDVSYTHPSIVDHDVQMPTTILVHKSGHSGDDGRRDNPREIRKAWVFGSRNTWEGTSVTIPDPVR